MRWGQSLSAFGAPALEHQAAVLGGHSRAKSVRLGATTIVGLKSPLRHR